MPFKKLFFIVLFLTHLEAYTQNVEWGNPQKLKQKNLYTQIVGESASGVYLLRCKDNEFSSDVIIEKYKANLSLEQTIPLPLTINGNVERVLLVNQSLFVFMSAKNTTTQKIDLLVQKLDENLKVVGAPYVICSIEKEKFLDKRKIQIKTNADKSKVGIMYVTKGADDENCALNLYCFNNQVQQVYGKQFNLNYNPAQIFVTSFDLNNPGDAFILIDFPKSRKMDNSNDPRDFYLYSYFQSNDRILEYPLNNDSIFIEELGMAINNFNQTVLVTGLYSSNKAKDVDGYFYKRFNIQTQLNELNYQNKIDEQVLHKIRGTKIERGNPELTDYFIRKFIPRSDGGALVVYEKYYQTRQTYTYYVNNFPQTATRIIYNYDDVAILSIDKKGEIQFTDVIKKRQNSVSDGGYLSSIIIIPTTDFVYLAYNSEVEKESNILLHYLNYQGKSDSKIMVKSTNFDAAIIPSEYKQTAANSGLFCTIRDKQFTLMRVTF